VRLQGLPSFVLITISNLTLLVLLFVFFSFFDLRSFDLVADPWVWSFLSSIGSGEPSETPCLAPTPLPIVRQSRPIGSGVGNTSTLEGAQSLTRDFTKYVTTLCALIGFQEPLGGETW
jgi:hypothetical protein